MNPPVEPALLESGIEDISGFVTSARPDVIAILDHIVARRALVTVYFGNPCEHIITNLLNLNPGFEELVFDRAQDDGKNQRLIRASQTDFVTFADDIKIQFSATRPETTTYAGRPALRTRMPQSLLRFQRRDSYRVPAPRSGPLTCEINLAGGTPAKFAVTDLSVGGIGVLTGPVQPEFQPGAVFPHCRVELPGHGNFVTALEIKHNKTGKLATLGQWRHHYGCQFHNLSGPVVTQIQRYINQLERSRRTLV